MNMQIGTIDLRKLRFVFDKSSGLTKELLGVLIGNNRLQEEGEHQQERATEEARALRKEVEAQKHQARADAYDKREKAAQSSK